MIISSRTQAVLQILIEADTHITVQNLAEKMNLAERTIYKEIAEIKEVIKSCGLTLEVISGKGLRLCGNSEGFQYLAGLIEKNEVNYEWNNKNRLDMLKLVLLSQNESIKTNTIAILLNVSVQTVRNDLKLVQKELEQMELALEKRKGEGIYVAGNSIRKGHCATSIIMNYVNTDIFFGIFQKKKRYKNYFITTILEEYGYDEILDRIRDSIGNFLIEQFNGLSDVKFEEFILLFMMLIKHHSSFDAYEKFDGTDNYNEYDLKLAKKIRDSLQNEFELIFDESEFQYILWLVGMNNSYKNLDDNDSRWKIVNKVRELVSLFEGRMGVHINMEQDFFYMLYEHINGSIERGVNGVHVTNPLRKEIEGQYGDVIKVLESCLTEVFPDHHFSEDEISYLVLYFAVAVDKSTEKSFRTLVVCTSGMGSSKLLASRLEREIPEIYIHKTISLIQLYQEDLYAYDLILSTVPLDIGKDRYMVVTPLLNAKEVEKIKDIISKKERGRSSRSGKFYSTIFNHEEDETVTVLEKIGKIADLGLELMEKFRIIPISGIPNEREKIRKCLVDFGLLPNENRGIEYLISEISPISGTKLGYLEIEYSVPVRPSFIMLLHDEDEYSDEMKAIITLVYSNKIDEYMLDMLSNIIVAIVDNIKVILSHADSAVMMRQVLENGVRTYLRDNY